ncbi:MAG: carbohydrate ABC transporter permease [Anaerolineae bacterium]
MRTERRSLGSLSASAVTVFASIIWLLPLIFAVLMSVRPRSEPINVGNIFFGSTITLENYNGALALAPWGWHYLTTIIFVVGVLVVQLVTITMAGYAFARLKFVGRGILLFLILLQIMIPTAVLLVQNFATIRVLGLFDTRWALMLPYWGSAFGVLLMRQAFREVPFELEEAARIDGANWLQIMRHVYVPLTIPTYVAFALVSISSHWNEFLWPFIVTRTEEVRPLTVGLNKLYQTTDVGALYGQSMAGTLIVVAPLVILFILFQRRFIESFASSGIK